MRGLIIFTRSGLLYSIKSPTLTTCGIFTSPLKFCDENKDEETKKKNEELVTVVDSNDKILGVKTKGDAIKLANKQNLKLMKWEGKDTPAKKFPVYKLFTAAQFVQKQLTDQPKATTTTKNLLLSSKTSDHDIEVKLKSAKKWLEKECHVHVVVQGDGSSKKVLENIYSKIENSVKEHGKIMDKRIKNGTLKFNLVTLPKK